MQKADSPRGKWRNAVFALTALLVVAADQLSKIWIRANLDPGESAPETGLFQLTHVQNTGASFGLFQGQSFSLTIVAFIGIAVILFVVLFISRRFPFLDNRLGKTALGLVLGGAVGNLIDRLRSGHVTDFIDIGIWPSFNVADSAVTVGVIMLAYSLLSLSRAQNTDSPA